MVYDSTRIEVGAVTTTTPKEPKLYFEQDEKNLFIVLSLIFWLVLGSGVTCFLDHKDYEQV